MDIKDWFTLGLILVGSRIGWLLGSIDTKLTAIRDKGITFTVNEDEDDDSNEVPEP
jgi:hypothetical protein